MKKYIEKIEDMLIMCIFGIVFSLIIGAPEIGFGIIVILLMLHGLLIIFYELLDITKILLLRFKSKRVNK
jgi:hypothetical protein